MRGISYWLAILLACGLVFAIGAAVYNQMQSQTSALTKTYAVALTDPALESGASPKFYVNAKVSATSGVVEVVARFYGDGGPVDATLSEAIDAGKTKALAFTFTNAGATAGKQYVVLLFFKFADGNWHSVPPVVVSAE